ncbi:AAA family ATPase [Kineosporia sp. J2-2]|uniref:AAA family ATPase n=1 Tax=Kineosporia corallincola TaxID=2835133 RepID=A0ABS5TSI6_9ACTN|nr:ATP-dependent RecD-like DNA helicase [Kineosporia corallincola]MBT0773724.1 AAA family ATPase [Kineosporia corallincola]
MSTVHEQILRADQAISLNIAALTDQRALLSQNVLAQLRNLVEGAAVLAHRNQPEAVFDYEAIEAALKHVRGVAKLNVLTKFHKLIQISASHYTLDGDSSERLMLKYYEYLLRVRTLLNDKFGVAVLGNLEQFPVDLDPSLQEYHAKIAAQIQSGRAHPRAATAGRRNRYYINRTRPFFVDGRIFYEVTFCRAVNRVNKFDRVIAFTDIDMTDEYAALLTLRDDSIDVLGQTMPITIIQDWRVSIRPCEIDNFARLLGLSPRARAVNPEYQRLMQWLTTTSGNLLDLLTGSDDFYAAVRDACTLGVSDPSVLPVLDAARPIVQLASPGHNLLRYLASRMRNEVLKPQYSTQACTKLSGLYVQYGCIPFDTMPLCSWPIRHIPRYWDLAHSINTSSRNHEVLARRVRTNVDNRGMLYTPATDLESIGNVEDLIRAHNNNVYYLHQSRHLLHDKGQVFIRGYEDDTVSIVQKLQELAAGGIDGYTDAVDQWLTDSHPGIDDRAKREALRQMFSQSQVAVVYGAAGTGKSTIVDHIANYFNDKSKLFLAHTNPATDNLKRKVSAQNSTFLTISSHLRTAPTGPEYDLLVIDECSTVSNADLLKVLEQTTFKLLVLVGDVFQIASIQFGNWFSIIRSFIPATSVFELTTPFRSTNPALLAFWNKVRQIDDDIAEIIVRNGYATVLGPELFQPQQQDEIILCLNYDGLYGINNINRFLQSSNPNPPVRWGVSTYKVGDPVVFHETQRFRPVIYNNLKGWIVAIESLPGRIQFDVKLDRSLTAFDVTTTELQWLGDSVVRFDVYDRDTSDEDDDSLNTSIPFQVAYAVSIHKAQGLEYDSVKIVITDANEDDITHNIFYTAITRARDNLQIFWTPETQQAVLKNLSHDSSPKDAALLVSRRGLIKA